MTETDEQKMANRILYFYEMLMSGVRPTMAEYVQLSRFDREALLKAGGQVHALRYGVPELEDPETEDQEPLTNDEAREALWKSL